MILQTNKRLRRGAKAVLFLRGYLVTVGLSHVVVGAEVFEFFFVDVHVFVGAAEDAVEVFAFVLN